MKHLRCCLVVVMGCTLPSPLVTGTRADFITQSGLQPGDQFRVVFVTTTTTTATSNDISFYDNIVQNDAASANLTTFNGSPVTWEAIVSTDAVSAVSRLPMDNVPIVLRDGTMVATSGTALWNTASGGSGAYLLNQINETAAGASITTWTWTGTFPFGNGVSPDALGDATPLNGFTGSTNPNDFTGRAPDWIDSGPVFAPTEQESLYGFSSILTVPELTAVPAPSTVTLLGIGSLGLLGYGWRRRRQSA